jgi:hypothetical protein
MGKTKILLGGLFAILISLSASWATAQVPGRLPGLAFDSVNNRYLMVWEEDRGSGYQIKGKFLNPDGSDAGTVQVLSPNRADQGCFYENFDSDNGPVTTPTDCPNNRKPSVAYNDGKFLITWEVAGNAEAPSTSPDNQFAVIFARMVDADDLSPLSGWGEGIMISKIYIAADRPGGCGSSGDYLCEDDQIQAWSQSRNSHVAGRLSGTGFVVVWETNIDYIDCYSSDRRGGWSVYGRFIDEDFSATSSSNPALFAIFRDDSTIDEKCATLDNVDNATTPRIAFNGTSGDFVAVYKIGRANGGRTAIGAKKVTVDAGGTGMATASMMPDLVASSDTASLNNPDVIAFKGDYILFADDGSAIYAKKFTSNGIANSTPLPVDLGSGNHVNAGAATNLGQGGQGPTNNGAPERILLSYTQSGAVFTALLDEALALQGAVEDASTGIATENQNSIASGNQENFLVAWQGKNDGDQVFVTEIASGGVDPTPTPTPTPTPDPTPEPPTAPTLDAQPSDDATWAPTRLYLSWQAATDPDAGDSVSYNVYFVLGNDVPSGMNPYRSGITDTHFIIQASTDARPQYEPDNGITPIYLAANTDYAWKVCAADTQGHETCSGVRQFHTDDSVVGWWRFDEDPNGSDCPGGQVGETICDYSGNSNHGISNGGVTWLAPGLQDVLGGGFTFDGVDDSVLVQYDSKMDVGSSIAFSCRINPNGEGLILDRNNPITGPYILGIEDPSVIPNNVYCGLAVSGNWDGVSGDYSSVTGNYFRTTCIYTGPDLSIYINQSLAETKSIPGPVLNNSNNLKFGINEYANFYHDGSIDECIIFSRRLTQDETVGLSNSDS